MDLGTHSIVGTVLGLVRTCKERACSVWLCVGGLQGLAIGWVAGKELNSSYNHMDMW